jgi:hypothetical protein
MVQRRKRLTAHKEKSTPHRKTRASQSGQDDRPMNTINVISPYRHDNTWVFDDARLGLEAEPLVCGADTLIDCVVARDRIPNADRGFALIFSGTPFPGYQYRLDWRRREEPEGDWYYSADFDTEGWLCGHLTDYVPEAPKHLYILTSHCGRRSRPA